jgi:hypothetical protein
MLSFCFISKSRSLNSSEFHSIFFLYSRNALNKLKDEPVKQNKAIHTPTASPGEDLLMDFFSVGPDPEAFLFFLLVMFESRSKSYKSKLS